MMVSPYLKHQLRQVELRDQALAQRRRMLDDAARRMAAALEQRFQPQRIILFGSLATGDISRGSDVDLAIEGLAPEDYWSAWVLADQTGRVPFDLIRLETASPSLRSWILSTGVVLFDRQ
ncbi:MAG: nucleotidyltransferase domain-containing protein [Thermaerobacterales bacterium]